MSPSPEREAVIVDAVRTPIGRRKGALAGWHPTDLLAHTLHGLLDRVGVEPERVDDVVGGCVTQIGEQGCNVVRNAWVAAGLPQSVPATSVDRQCGSSQQAIHFAAQGVLAGSYDIAIACGVESMSRAPLASNTAGGDGPFSASFVAACDGQLKTQFEVAQILARKWGIDREAMDGYALESHRRAAAADFSPEILPVGDVAADEGIRRDTTLEQLAALPPATSWDPELAPDITAGNSSQMSDAAAAMLVADRSVAEALGLPIRARIRHMVVRGDDAVLVLSAPNPVTRLLLDRTGLSIDDFDAIECNEAFAAIALMWAAEFLPHADLSRFNPRGGAIALGHPLGASGVRLMTTLLNQLESTGGRLGFQTMCEGGGMANATVVERLG
ncbi:MAG: acetyl-CoA C-acyltransferase [Acidimicrobiales bacterium]